MTVSVYSTSRSYSLLKRRLRPSQASVRSTTQRRGSTTNPTWSSAWRTISSVRPCCCRSQAANSAPVYPWSAHRCCSVGQWWQARRNTQRAPSRSSTSAACTTTASSHPCVSTTKCRLRPRTFFPPVPAALAASFGALDALTINDCGRRGFGAAHLPPGLPHQLALDDLQRAVAGPFIEVVAHALPLGIFAREQAPLAARPRKVQQGVQHRPQIQLRWPAPPAIGRQIRRDQFPLLIRQVRWVALPPLWRHQRWYSSFRFTPSFTRVLELYPGRLALFKRALSTGSPRYDGSTFAWE